MPSSNRFAREIAARDGDLVEDATLTRIASILGDSSAAAAALRDLERRRVEGEDAACYLARGVYLVGPRRTSPSQ